MSDDYAPPNRVVEEWKKHCNCCEQCQSHPCDAVCAGGLCDAIECVCFDEPYHEEPHELEDECYMGSDGQCAMAGTEYCDWECPDGGC